MIKRYALVEAGMVAQIVLASSNAEPWAGAILVDITGLECCVGAKWDGAEFTLNSIMTIEPHS